MKPTKSPIPTTSFYDEEVPTATNTDGTPSKCLHKGKWVGLTRKDKKNMKKYGDKAFMVTMMFSNGTCREFVIVGKTETFTYKKRTYYLRYEDSWFNLTQNQFNLFFWDDCPVPISRNVIKKGDKKFFAVTPENLAPLIKMEYVKALSSSDELQRMIKTTMIFCIIQLGISGLMLIILLSLKTAIKTMAGG